MGLEFIQEPGQAVLRSGLTISFTCSTVSSPEPSSINWSHKGSVISQDNRNDHHDISTVTTMNNGTVMTESTFTIYNLTGFDSGDIECVADYLASDLSTNLGTITSTTMLGVLGKLYRDFAQRILMICK